MKSLALICLLAMSLAATAQPLPVSGETFVSTGSAASCGISPTVNVGLAGNYQGIISFDHPNSKLPL